MSIGRSFSVVVFSTVFSVVAFANQIYFDDGSYLDPKYTNHVHPKKEKPGKAQKFLKSNIESLIANQTDVKSQQARGTCSIFASTALLESMLVIKKGFKADLDLSEEWLEYVIMRKTASEGSSSYANFNAFFSYGSAREELLPYIGYEWKDVIPGDISETKCGHIDAAEAFKLKACLLGHRDPDLLNLKDDELKAKDVELFNARTDANQLRDGFVKSYSNKYAVYNVDDVKANLYRGIPMTLDLDFYYGAWNHRLAENHLMSRNMDHWYKGIVGYPLTGSVDQIESPKEPAGHAIVVVGYDDEYEVELEHLMPDGQIKKIKYKGVYYFKNSWGTSNFGVQFEVGGKAHPGYGMIVQQYAHEYGTFYRLPLK